MAGKFSIVLEEECREPLERLAVALGYLWGDGPNVKALVQAIARGQLSIGNATALANAQILALVAAVNASYARGAWQNALVLAELCEALPGVAQEVKAEVSATVAPLRQQWVGEVFLAIQQQHPFKLAYQDAAGRPIQFSVCGAQFVPHERRTYLDCWCVETEGNQDIHPLQHNWCLRLDRIVNAEIISIKRKWRPLDTVVVEMQLTGRLAYAYEERSEDVAIKWVGEAKQVQRRISNSFWFIREVLQYGRDCQVLAPVELREQVLVQLRESIQQYETLLKD
jgi:predicted DNA-binding transcriptional regulator YafY